MAEITSKKWVDKSRDTNRKKQRHNTLNLYCKAGSAQSTEFKRFRSAFCDLSLSEIKLSERGHFNNSYSREINTRP